MNNSYVVSILCTGRKASTYWSFVNAPDAESAAQEYLIANRNALTERQAEYIVVTMDGYGGAYSTSVFRIVPPSTPTLESVV